MGAGKRLGLDVSAGNIVLPAFAQTDWTIIHNDLKATAESAGVILQPGTYSNANVFPIRVPPNANRILTRVRYATAISAVATQAQVAMFGAYGDDSYFDESTGVFNDTGSIRWARLDRLPAMHRQERSTRSPHQQISEIRFGNTASSLAKQLDRVIRSDADGICEVANGCWR